MSFSDMLPGGTTVPLGKGKSVEVRGMSPRAMRVLAGRFRGLVLLWLSGQLQIAKIFDDYPELSAALMAAAVGRPGDAAAEAEMAEQPLHVTLKLLETYYQETIGEDGEGPFWERAQRVLALVGIDVDLQRKSDDSKPPASRSQKADQEKPAA